MKVTIVQADIEWADVRRNLCRLDVMVRKLPYADLYVLPEMFSTGFCTDPDTVAEPDGGETLRWMRLFATECGCAITGSVSVKDGDEYRNRLYFVYPDGQVVHYDKRHLFTYGGEDKAYSGGDERVVVEYKGVRILLQVCYDLRFPVWSRNRNDYDMAVYVANWPLSRARIWAALLCARAIENQCYVVGVNRVGNDPVCEYSGGSVVIDPYGKTVAECVDGEESVASAEINMEKLNAFRVKFPVLNDADVFHVET